MGQTAHFNEGRVARKRREIHERIAFSALDLFTRRGFEETTVDAIADAADISRRSFFHYFASKEDVVFFWKEEFAETMLEAEEAAENELPMDLLERILIGVAERYQDQRIIELDKLIRATPALMARRLVHYDTQERRLAAVMASKWPERDPSALRLVAIAGLGLLRASVDAWSREGYRRPFVGYVAEAAGWLRVELGGRDAPLHLQARRARPVRSLRKARA